ncbi:MAG: cell envelope integrity protein CreD [Gammaproteobacteria bacterium]|nr:cell envelope integrity protein CreD [Gammaproteobacteria bacterium]
MNKKFTYKVGIILFLMLMLLIPLKMIHGVVDERTAYRSEAQQAIAQSWTGSQKVLGPVLVVPYTEYYKKREWDSNLKAYQERRYSRSKQLLVLPETLRIDGNVVTENRQRGLYSIPVYSSALEVAGIFNNAKIQQLSKEKGKEVRWHESYLSMIVSDIRGISEQPTVVWAGKDYVFASGSALEQFGTGMHAPLGALATDKIVSYPFSFRVHLKGMQEIQFAAVGKSTTVSIKSNWPHPSFVGRYLPTQRTIGEGSFEATWQLSSFSSDMPRLIKACEEENCIAFLNNTFGVALFNSVDIYHQAVRSVKYAILFISLTFIAFFLFEIMKNLRLHPMQYLLVGLSLTFFYLLLVSLSEHMPYIAAYGIAASSNVGIIAVYLGAILKSRKLALGFSAMLSVLYMMLYAILLSEDNALLMGSLMFFAVLSMVMIVTRKIDWYEVTERLSNQSVLKTEKR